MLSFSHPTHTSSLFCFPCAHSLPAWTWVPQPGAARPTQKCSSGCIHPEIPLDAPLAHYQACLPFVAPCRSEAKSEVLERVDCSPLLPDHPRKALRCYRKWLVQNINLVVEPRLLRAAVDRALGELWRKSGVAPPAGFAPVEDVPQELMEASRLAEW